MREGMRFTAGLVLALLAFAAFAPAGWRFIAATAVQVVFAEEMRPVAEGLVQ